MPLYPLESYSSNQPISLSSLKIAKPSYLIRAGVDIDSRFCLLDPLFSSPVIKIPVNTGSFPLLSKSPIKSDNFIPIVFELFFSAIFKCVKHII